MRSCSARRRMPSWAPNCAPTTPPTSRISASSMSTVKVWVACSSVVTAVTNMIWNSEVPTTTEVGIPSR